MARARIVVDDRGRFAGVRIDCPGCGVCVLPTDWTPLGYARAPALDAKAQWHFNGDLDRPTFSPSIAVRSGHYAGQDKASCWCTYNAANPTEAPVFACMVCHSFVQDGRIQFLGDCTHALAGQTVDLPELVDAPA